MQNKYKKDNEFLKERVEILNLQIINLSNQLNQDDE